MCEDLLCATPTFNLDVKLDCALVGAIFEVRLEEDLLTLTAALCPPLCLCLFFAASALTWAFTSTCWRAGGPVPL